MIFIFKFSIKIFSQYIICMFKLIKFIKIIC
jgi:hypothetical protein